MPQVVHQDDTLRIVVERNVVVSVWWDAPLPGQLVTVQGAANKLKTEYPNAFAWLNVIIQGTPKFPATVREEAANLGEQTMSHAVGSAHVITVDGIKGATVRAFITGILMIVRSRRPMKVFGTMEEASGWFLDVLNAAPTEARWTAAQLSAVYQQAVAAPLRL